MAEVDRGADLSRESARLMHQVAAGSHEAFERLYHTWAPVVLRYLAARGVSAAAAADIVQETFLAAWRQAASYREEAPLATWLFGIARHKRTDWVRQHPPPVEPDPSREPQTTADPTYEAVEARTVLGRLTADERELVFLVFVSGLSYEEVARVLEIPVGTVKSRVFRLRHTLKARTAEVEVR